MKRIYILSLSLLVSFIIFNSMAMATVTQSGASPSEGATDVHVSSDFSVLLNATSGTMDYNLSLYQGTTLIQYITDTGEVNGTLAFPLDTLNGSTLYTVWVNVTDTDGYTNATYNFTTGIMPLTLDIDTFSVAEILLLGIIIIIIIGFLYSVILDFQKGTFDIKTLMNKLVVTIFFVVMIMILGYMI